MLVRSVHVDQVLTEQREGLQSGGRTVDELAIRTSRAERSFDDKLAIGARFRAVILQQCIDRLCAFRFRTPLRPSIDPPRHESHRDQRVDQALD